MKSLSNKAYDILKYLTIIVLPAIGALYSGLSQIWQLPYAAEVPATITVICTFLGAILCISTAQYNAAQTGKHLPTGPTYGPEVPDPDADDAKFEEILREFKTK